MATKPGAGRGGNACGVFASGTVSKRERELQWGVGGLAESDRHLLPPFYGFFPDGRLLRRDDFGTGIFLPDTTLSSTTSVPESGEET